MGLTVVDDVNGKDEGEGLVIFQKQLVQSRLSSGTVRDTREYLQHLFDSIMKSSPQSSYQLSA